MRGLAVLVALLAGAALFALSRNGAPDWGGLDGDRMASLLYLGVWGMLLSSSVVVPTPALATSRSTGPSSLASS